MDTSGWIRAASTAARLALGALVAALAISSGALADEWPALRHGMWDITRTMQPPGGGEPKAITTKRCMDPVEEWKRQRTQLTQAGCTFSPIQRSGSTFTFTSACDTMGVSSKSTTTIVVESEGAYTLTVDGTMDGRASHEVMKARRVGDCPK